MTYNIVLQKAHARTFNLINRIKEVKKIREDNKKLGTIMQQKSLLDADFSS